MVQDLEIFKQVFPAFPVQVWSKANDSQESNGKTVRQLP
jgi:hypothetical protein